MPRDELGSPHAESAAVSRAREPRPPTIGGLPVRDPVGSTRHVSRARAGRLASAC